MLRNGEFAHYVLSRETGNKILVTKDNHQDYIDSVKFIKLDEPVLEEVSDPLAPLRKVKVKAKYKKKER